MRSNLPILDEAFPFPTGESLVSTTDLKGRITYCNPAFIHVSGYEREELLGQPHNLIRHSDMPAEAFRDVWATVQSGEPWTALVKNRRKDGRYYWVRANVTPLVVDGKPVGYMSVRTAPSAADAAQAGQLYAQLNAEAQSPSQRLGLRSGQVVRLDWVGRLRSLFNLDLAGQLTLTAVILASTSFLMGAVATGGLSLLQGGGTLVAGVVLLGLVSLGRGVFVHVAVRPIQELLRYAMCWRPGICPWPVIPTARTSSGSSPARSTSCRSICAPSCATRAPRSTTCSCQPRRSPRATRTCRPAPSRRPAAWSKPPPRWSRLPGPCAKVPIPPSRPRAWPCRPHQ